MNWKDDVDDLDDEPAAGLTYFFITLIAGLTLGIIIGALAVFLAT